ncbi:DUF1810 domain-containing protein [Cytophaga hutchinsonii]|uniref:Calpastatin n=1 Tax=Cytophaga hutchinsonii (strain ATCC 33406 / DSM 1761 / CIP 103989 / NBRC 15051 / NCIMB 9469 / D465) TaxID=269798 RepID=A0A6N4ST91_CYTH3|nr:DUF1810 domain-containing protein [Cytophaga hutchinsonii]ABG59589.1 conserved hypothetical protein [Cytophaga hutchinsonii ATCC 33406]SFX67615.1 Uncharacterized protein, DUF1810 family [Cytophaga hutchinsonii ATCC 33406]
METKDSLSRFLKAQEGVYAQAQAEIKKGRKTSHWMWFIFPQIQGLGHSETARYYAIHDLEEATRYQAHPVLGKRLVEISTILLHHPATSAVEIFGTVDSLKLHASMTLFSLQEHAHPVFKQVLDVFYAGKRDAKTVALLQEG